jgi:ferredoxin
MPHISAAKRWVGCENRSRPPIYANDQGDDDIVDTASAPAKRGGFTVELARSGREFFIPEGQTILEVLLDEGVDVDYSCELGICGACEQRVISGIPEHRDSILTEEEQAENKRVMICCAGCKSDRLVLDL